MKHFYLKALLILAFSVTDITASAYDVEIDGIFYYLDQDGTASVTYRINPDNRDYNDGDYSGNVTVPSSITYEGLTYTVDHISTCAFFGCSNLTSINLPSSLRFIDFNSFTNCYGLTSITIPNKVRQIDEKSFDGCI